MRGQVLSVDATGGGLISGDDGQRYSFNAGATRGVVRNGAQVDFLGLDGVANDVVVLAEAAPPASSYAGGYAGIPESGKPYDFGWSMFSFQGRLRRSHFWINWAILFGVGLVLGWIPILGTLISLVCIWPNVAIGVKRLHDMGRTGWLIMAPFVGNIVVGVIAFMSIGMSALMNAEALEREDPSAILGLMGPMFGLIIIAIIVNLGFLIWIGVTDSQPGRNRFGPNPKYPAQDDVSVF